MGERDMRSPWDKARDVHGFCLTCGAGPAERHYDDCTHRQQPTIGGAHQAILAMIEARPDYTEERNTFGDGYTSGLYAALRVVGALAQEAAELEKAAKLTEAPPSLLHAAAEAEFQRSWGSFAVASAQLHDRAVDMQRDYINGVRENGMLNTRTAEATLTKVVSLLVSITVVLEGLGISHRPPSELPGEVQL